MRKPVFARYNDKSVPNPIPPALVVWVASWSLPLLESMPSLLRRRLPVGAILIKGKAFEVPIGERVYDKEPIAAASVRRFQAREALTHG